MSAAKFLNKSAPSFNHYSILRLQTRRFSAPSQSPASHLPLIPAGSNHDAGQQKHSVNSSLMKWMSGLAVGSSLGFLYWSSTSSGSLIDKWNSSFPDWFPWITETTEDRRSPTLLKKYSLPDNKSTFLLGDSFRRKVFFNYERRIRSRSPPEKVFEYFASYKTPEGELLMKPVDLMRAIVPVFPPSESELLKNGYLRGERNPGELRCPASEFFMLLDINNDGLISFKEYIFFITLLSIPESSFSTAFKMFDIDKDGEVNKEEFKKVMALMRTHNRQGVAHRDGLRFGLKVNDSVNNGGLVEYFFGKDGNARLSVDKFIQFMRDLQEELLRLEFAHYDYKNRGTISLKDFALSVVASADMNQLGMLLDRVNKISSVPYFRDIRVTFEEFKNFAELRRKLQPFAFALLTYGKVNGLLTRNDFQLAAFQVCDISLTDNVVDVIFHLFDSNRDGNICVDEFIRVLHNRERDIAQPVETGFFGLLSSCSGCSSIRSFFS